MTPRGRTGRTKCASVLLSAALFLLALALAQFAQAAPCDYQFGTVGNESYKGPGAGGICVAASFIDGCVYLQHAFPSLYGGTALPTGNLSSQRTAMEAWAVDGWTPPGGTFHQGYYTTCIPDGNNFGDWWQNAVAWTEAFAPGRTAYSAQAGLTRGGESSASWVDNGNVQDLFPTTTFLSAAVAANAFIEMGIYQYGYNDGVLVEHSGHAIDLVNLTCANGLYTMSFFDPNNPNGGFFSAVLGTMTIDGQTALNFVAPAGATYQGQNVYLAGAIVETPVPEPATLSLLTLGLAALALRRKHK